MDEVLLGERIGSRLISRLLPLAAMWALLVSAAPAFVPTGADLYQDFSALSEPRADVPVGALWVQGYGPFGEGAPADNLVVVRSLSGITLNREQHLRLTLGLLNFLNIDPGYRSRVSARLSDVTIVRVKDIARLAGPAGEPRIYEALRAGAVTVTVDTDVGTDLSKTGGGFDLPLSGRAQGDRKRSFTLDGRDLFVAYRIASSEALSGKVHEVTATEDGRARIAGFDLQLDVGSLDRCSCAGSPGRAQPACQPAIDIPVALSKRRGDWEARDAARAILKTGGATRIPLPVPVSDGDGGIFTALSVTLLPEEEAGGSRKERGAVCAERARTRPRLQLSLEGERLETLASPQARGW